MTINKNVIQLMKGISLSSLLLLLGACQNVTAQTAVDGLESSLHSSAAVEEIPQPEVQSEVALRFEEDRKAEKTATSKETPAKPEETQPTTPVEESVQESVPVKPKEEEEIPAVEKPVAPQPAEPEEEQPVEEEPATEVEPVEPAAKAEEPVAEPEEEEVAEQPVYTYEPSYETIVIPYETLYVLNDDMDNDQFQTLQEGKDGEMIHTWLHTYKDGVWESKHVTKTAVYDPVPRIMMVGTNIVHVPKNSTYEQEKARIEALPLVPSEPN